MADTILPKPDPDAFSELMRARGLALHAKDEAPTDRRVWEERKPKLCEQMFRAMGPFPEKACALEPKDLGVLKREGFRIEKLTFQSRPDVWVTANAYVPDPLPTKKVPAVLCVHGHWSWARIDPNVTARCVGLAKLGFFVLAVDAFGSGERYTKPAPGTYHGGLYGSTLWPTGQTLLGMQVYDNRRAVDYLCTRPEVDADRLGVTGASGGGNQTMYAGALDERFKAAVPVCSVGTYQSYLHSACCVCEVLPTALTMAEEGDVLALVAPRALMVVNASKDNINFSIGEAQKSIARARKVFDLYKVDGNLKHATFESPHAYNQPMREAMYGWMTLWLKGEGDGKPIAEPKFTPEKPGDLRCYPGDSRPKDFVTPVVFAGRTGRALVAKLNERIPDHAEDWESRAVHARTQLRKEVLGGLPDAPKPDAKLSPVEKAEGVETTPALLFPEPGMPVPFLLRSKTAGEDRQPAAVLLHMEGKSEALKHPLAAALVKKGWLVAAPDLRATGETKPRGGLAGAADHHVCEHALWVGRPLLGQWIFDTFCVLDWLGIQKRVDRRRLAVIGIGPAGIVALGAAALGEDRIASAAALGSYSTYVTDEPYAPGMYMGLLAPGILHWADVPHLAALAAPRRVILAGSITPQAKKLGEKEMQEAYSFPRAIYKLYKAEDKVTLAEMPDVEKIAESL
jgi:dienelactone hydrolase